MVVTRLKGIVALGLVALSCSTHGGPAEADPLCGAPRRAIVAEMDSRSSLLRLATDTLAEGLDRLGFQVLAPRRELPAGRRAINDWIFTTELIETSDGRMEVNVELRSLLEDRRVWAIADALSELDPGDPRLAVQQGIAAALTLFEQDLLRCRSE